MNKPRAELRRLAIYSIAAAIMMWGLLYAPTPYVSYEPGIAVSVKPMVSIEGAGMSLEKVIFC